MVGDRLGDSNRFACASVNPVDLLAYVPFCGVEFFVFIVGHDRVVGTHRQCHARTDALEAKDHAAARMPMAARVEDTFGGFCRFAWIEIGCAVDPESRRRIRTHRPCRLRVVIIPAVLPVQDLGRNNDRGIAI